MTWTYERTANSVVLYDHNGNTVAELPKTARIPDDLLAAAGDELDARGWDLTDSWVREALKTALVEDFEKL